MAAKTKSRSAAKTPAKKKVAMKSSKTKSGSKKVVLLSGGNPQIAKGYGDAPVKAYIAALPDPWKVALAKRIDAIIEKTVPGVHKAVKWNSPMYGLEDDYWFVSMHAFARYMKVAFFRGVQLKPNPPGPSKVPNTRYLDIYEDDAFDEAQFASWIKQAAALPGEKM